MRKKGKNLKKSKVFKIGFYLGWFLLICAFAFSYFASKYKSIPFFIGPCLFILYGVLVLFLGLYTKRTSVSYIGTVRGPIATDFAWGMSIAAILMGLMLLFIFLHINPTMLGLVGLPLAIIAPYINAKLRQWREKRN